MPRLVAYLALAVPVLAWGLSFISIKVALTEFPPMTLALGRFLLAGAVLGVFYFWKGTKTKFSPRDRVNLVLSVVTGITLYFFCENNGVKLIPASVASLIIAGIPILSLLAERVVHGTKLGWVGVVSTVVSFGGTALLLGVPAGGSANVGGYVLMFGAAVAWVLYLFTMKPLQASYPNLAVTAWQMILGAVSLIPFALAEVPQWRWPSAAGWGHLVFQGLVCSALSYLLYNYSLEKLGVRVASLSVNLLPVITAVASYVLLGEVLGPWQWVGGALVLGAVIAVSRQGERP
jgi:drug/metabolite transporter (DMT)-like permease